MPRLWHDTIEAHRREVRDKILEATVALVGKVGLRAVTMLKVAEETGIGRATLYKYFPDIDSILVAWHQQRVEEHFGELVRIRDGAGTPVERLLAVLENYAGAFHEHRGHELVALLHRGEHFAHAQKHLKQLLRELVTEGVRDGALRSDVPADELATYSLSALSAASELPSAAAVKRLVTTILSGLRSPTDSTGGRERRKR